MTNTKTKNSSPLISFLKKLSALVLIFLFIIISVLIIRAFPKSESEFIDTVASQIEQEMADNQIVLSTRGGRRTVSDFKEPIILTHGKDSRLIVHTAELSESITVGREGIGGWAWTSTYQEIKYEGIAEYVVNLSELAEEDFMVNNESKTLTVRIPYAVLPRISILSDRTKFFDPEKGWAGPKDVTMTPEELSQIENQVIDKMKAKLIDEDILSVANESAKIVVADLLSATVHSIDPEFSVIIVQ